MQDLFDTHFHPNNDLGLTPPEFWTGHVKQNGDGSGVPALNTNPDLGNWNL